MITTTTGTTVAIQCIDGEDLVILDNPAAPADMRHHESGRIVEGGFQPAIFAAFTMSPEVLRAIADVIEAHK